MPAIEWDVFALPPDGSATSPTVTLATSAAADDIVDTAAAHGFVAGDKVVFTALTGGAGLTVGQVYYVIAANLAATTFQVSPTASGAAVDFTTNITAGSVHAILPLTYLATLYEASQKTIRLDLRGSGSGQFTVNKHDPIATAAILAQGNLVKVRFPEIDDDYIFAFFIETGDFTLISSQEEGGEMLTFGGRGALMYTEYAQAWSESFIVGGQDPIDGVWRAYAAGTGNKPGQILRRMLEEMQDPDRPQQPLPLLTVDFDYDLDSDGAIWASTDATDEFSYQVGDKGLAIIERLIQTDAITIQMGPDFDLHAYNDYGRDLAGTVQFERGVNIANELQRSLEPARGVTHMLVGGETDRYGTAVSDGAATMPVKEGFVTAFGTGATALNGIGAMELVTLAKRTDRVTFQIANRRTELSLADPVTVGSVIGPDATTGFYLPGPPGTNGDFWLGDTVTLVTGSQPFDLVGEARVEAITIGRDDDNGELIVIVEVEIIPPIPCPDFELPLTVSGFYGPLGEVGPGTGFIPTHPEGADIIFYKSGSTPEYPRPPDHTGDLWWFPVWDIVDGSLPAGRGDTAWSNTNSVADIYVVGFGTVTVHTGDSFGVPGTYDLELHHGDPISSYDVTEALGNFPAGADTDVVIPEDGHCVHMVRYNPRGTSNVEYTVFGGITWDGTYA